MSLLLEIDIGIYIDLDSMKIILIIHIYRLKIFTLRLNLISMQYRINRSRKLRRLKLIISDKEKIFISQIKESILDKLYYDKVSVQASIGNNNSQITSMTIGIMNNLCGLIDVYLKSINHSIEFNYNNQPNFITNDYKVSLNLRVYFTVFDMIFAIILSLYKRGNYAKKRKI